MRDVYNNTTTTLICPNGSDTSPAAELSPWESRELRQSEGYSLQVHLQGTKEEEDKQRRLCGFDFLLQLLNNAAMNRDMAAFNV